MASDETAPIRALLSSKPRPEGWQARRKRLDEVGAHWPVADDVILRSAVISSIPVEWSLVPGSDDARVLLFFHGGGYCSGSLKSHRRMVTEAGRAAGISTLAIGYRLAPEHPFPAAYEDALCAWHFLRGQGFAAGHIALGGDSAGGGLCLALALSLRNRGAELPACLWLASPWTDLTLSGASLESRQAVDPLISRPYLAELTAAYCGAGCQPSDPRLSPLFGQYKGMPPLLVQVGSAETLLDDAVRLAATAGAADVPTTLQIWPHMIHGWQLWNAVLPSARAALRTAGAFIASHGRAADPGQIAAQQ